MVIFNKHKDIGILYLIFALFSGLIGTFLSLLIDFNWLYQVINSLSQNYQLYNSIIPATRLL